MCIRDSNGCEYHIPTRDPYFPVSYTHLDVYKRQMLPIAEKMDKVGYFSIECWGGATFDTCIRYLNEDPWQRLRDIKDVYKRQKYG